VREPASKTSFRNIAREVSFSVNCPLGTRASYSKSRFSGNAAMATGGNYSPAAENSQNASVPSAARGENQRKELVRHAPPIPKHNPVKDSNTPHRKILIREGS
jgi:hypothetical protein